MGYNVHAIQWGVVLGASLVALVCDVRTGRIPNWLTLPLAAIGLVNAAAAKGMGGLTEATAAWVVLALPYIILFILAEGGAGDAKMMGAIGTWFGLRQGLIVLCCVAITGGILAVARLVVHRERKSLLSDVVALLYVHVIAVASGSGGWKLLKTDSRAQTDAGLRRVTIPYGVAIFLGVCVAAVVVHLWSIQ